MKKIKEFFFNLMDTFTIVILITIFIGSFIISLLIEPDIVEALKYSGIITISTIIFVVYGKYINEFEKNNHE